VPSAAPWNQSVHSCLGQLLETTGQFEGQPAAAEGEHRSPAVEVVELQDILAAGAEVVLQDSPVVQRDQLHIQAVAVEDGLLHSQGWDHLQDNPAAEVVGLPHILDLEGLLDAQDVELLDSPGVGLQDSPAVGVLHFQGMAEQELLVEEPQGMQHLGSQTSVKPLVL